MDTSDVISAGALFLAILAFPISIKSYLLSKKALLISEREHKERYMGITLYLIDVYKWKRNGETYISFALRFTNKATIPNSISSIELHLEYFDEQKSFGKIKIPTSNSVTPIDLREHSDLISNPLVMSEKSAKSGWSTFVIPKRLNDKFIIDIYRVVATTTDNKVTFIETHIVNEV
ncbi:hypothetical protein PTR41_12930 [Serratia bockelmannii]|uniref:hypothetical protein n=1 Tax=Serratia bockelmannii TaxID=2703793 RepID=UPI00313DF804